MLSKRYNVIKFVYTKIHVLGPTPQCHVVVKCWISVCHMFLPLYDAITKTCLYNVDPLKPHFYIIKLGFTGVYVIFLISTQKHRLWYSLEPPRQGSSNEFGEAVLTSTHNLCFELKYEKISEFFLSEKFPFLVVKFPICLNRLVFVMTDSRWSTYDSGFD